MWFVINISGKQEIVRINQIIDIDYIRSKKDDIIIFNRILFIFCNNNIKVGQPLINKQLKAIIIQHFYDKKILILRFKRKKHYKKFRGYKSKKTRVLIKELI